MRFELVQPDLRFQSSYEDYIAELGDEVRYPFPLDFDHRDFAALIRRLEDLAEGRNIPEGFVPSSTFWLVSGDTLAGVANLRHCLNDRIRHCGGHIGLGIRPSFRGQGLGRTLMAMTIERARMRGIGELHIHCHKDNEASARVIVANGGVLDSEIEHGEPARTVQRYLIAG